MQTPQLFLFDLDGTLIDSRADLAAATNAMRALHDLPPLPLDTVTAYVGDGIRVLAARALEGAAVDSDLAAREISAAYAAHLTDRTTAYAGGAYGTGYTEAELVAYMRRRRGHGRGC